MWILQKPEVPGKSVKNDKTEQYAWNLRFYGKCFKMLFRRLRTSLYRGQIFRVPGRPQQSLNIDKMISHLVCREKLRLPLMACKYDYLIIVRMNQPFESDF